MFYAASFLLTLLVSGSATAQQERLTTRYDETLQWVERRQNTALTLRTDSVHFRAEVREGTSFKGVPIRLSDLQEGERVDGLPHWYTTDIRDRTATLRYAGARFNALVVRSLLRMYQATGNPAYLRKARRRVDALLDELDNAKWVRFRKSDAERVYVARVNSFVLQAAAHYAEIAGEDYDARLVKMARSYMFTDEGVWNHWTSATIGRAVRARVLGQPLSGRGKIQETLERLRAQIRRHDGKIPYVQDPSFPSYPDFRETYQTVDAMLLVRLAAKTSIDVGIPSSYLWTLIWEEAIDVNYSTFWANNTVAALHLFQATGRTYGGWMQKQSEKPLFSRGPRSLREAVAKLRAVSAMALYHSLLEGAESASRIVVSAPRPNPASSTIQFSLRPQVRGRIAITVFDALGRTVKTRQVAGEPRTVLQERFEVDQLAAGTYFLRVRFEGASRVYKFIVL